MYKLQYYIVYEYSHVVHCAKCIIGQTTEMNTWTCSGFYIYVCTCMHRYFVQTPSSISWYGQDRQQLFQWNISFSCEILYITVADYSGDQWGGASGARVLGSLSGAAGIWKQVSNFGNLWPRRKKWGPQNILTSEPRRSLMIWADITKTVEPAKCMRFWHSPFFAFFSNIYDAELNIHCFEYFAQIQFTPAPMERKQF